MAGILLLLGIFVWLLIGKRATMTTKVAIVFVLVASYLFYLKYQGATNEQVLEILFSF